MHFLAELKEHVQDLSAQTKRKLSVIAESDLNDSRLLHLPVSGGYGLDAQWSDDFHHALHALLTNESTGYYGDFGTIEDLGVAIRDGWRYSGQFSKFRKRRHGNSPQGISPDHFVVFSQNHDQVGNRAGGERLATLVDFESAKLAAGVTLLSPFVPLLFMGEEYGEERPFQYFTSHGDAVLIEAVRRGRRDEFADFGWGDEVADPQDEATYAASVLHYAAKDIEPHRTLRRLYKSLLTLRKRFGLGATRPDVTWDEAAKTLTHGLSGGARLGHLPFRTEAGCSASPTLVVQSASAILNSADRDWRGLARWRVVYRKRRAEVWPLSRVRSLFLSHIEVQLYEIRLRPRPLLSAAARKSISRSHRTPGFRVSLPRLERTGDGANATRPMQNRVCSMTSSASSSS